MKAHLGFSLLEVLVSMALLSLTLVGTAKVQLTTLNSIQHSKQLTFAHMQLENGIARRHAGQTGPQLQPWRKAYRAKLAHSSDTQRCQGAQCTLQLTWRYQGKQHHLSGRLS